MFEYDPTAAKSASGALPTGTYPAQLESVKDGKSKSSGNPMQTLTFKVYRDGSTSKGSRLVDDYVVAATAWKLRNFALALDGGMPDGENMKAFGEGRFDAASHIGAPITVNVVLEISEEYGEQNKITGYAPTADGVASSARPAPEPAPEETDVPF